MRENMSQLDDALVEARSSESGQATFYNVFLNSNVYIPTHDHAIADTNPRRTKEGETFRPVMIEHQGRVILPIFDSVERLRNWAQREINYICMPAHALVRSIHGSVFFILNTGTQFAKEFVPEELKWLRESVEASQPKQGHIPAGTQMFVGSPAKIPDGLEDALRSCFLRNDEVHAAYLGQVFYALPGEKPHLVLVLKTAPLSETVLAAMQADVGVAIRGHLRPEEGIDVMFYNGAGVSAEVAKTVKPFYVNG
jgi:hypothetical protein